MRYVVYSGASMNPTLKFPDLLQVVPYGGRRIRRGDVILFSTPGDARDVVHRVVSVGASAIKARGDNNAATDPHILNLDVISGQVQYALRGSRRRPVYGGVLGRVFGTSARVRRFLCKSLFSILGPLYHWLSGSGNPVRRILPRIRTRIISFKRPAGTELHLLMGRRLIGRLPAGGDSWIIEPPFKVFVDLSALPPRPCSVPDVKNQRLTRSAQERPRSGHDAGAAS